MITPEERAEYRRRAQNALDFGPNVLVLTAADALRLIDALDAAVARAEKAEKSCRYLRQKVIVIEAPHRRERVFIVAYPHGSDFDGERRLLSPLTGILGDMHQPYGLSDWLGIRFDRQDRASACKAYRGPLLCRVDDGRPGRVDKPFWDGLALPPSVRRISGDGAQAMLPALKALANGIVPHQAYAIAACILIAEGLPVPPRP